MKLTAENIRIAVEALKSNKRTVEPLFCVHNREEWLSGFNEIHYKMTESELSLVDSKGFIKSVYGVNCYLSLINKTTPHN